MYILPIHGLVHKDVINANISYASCLQILVRYVCVIKGMASETDLKSVPGSSSRRAVASGSLSLYRRTRPPVPQWHWRTLGLGPRQGPLRLQNTKPPRRVIANSTYHIVLYSSMFDSLFNGCFTWQKLKIKSTNDTVVLSFVSAVGCVGLGETLHLRPYKERGV